MIEWRCFENGLETMYGVNKIGSTFLLVAEGFDNFVGYTHQTKYFPTYLVTLDKISSTFLLVAEGFDDFVGYTHQTRYLPTYLVTLDKKNKKK